MDAVFANFDEYLKAFGLTIGLFVVSGIASLVLGTILAVLRVGPVSVLNKAAAVYVTLFRNTPLLMIFIFIFIAMPVLG
ncbi:MAG TPA: ABC transporter permease subunit, partial [Nocardioides sp.]|nr:ABC transporter permease subunit [Nocardioides sp.]